MKTEMTLERIRVVLQLFAEQGIRYMVIAGVGLDGKRGFQTRRHQDLDVICLKEDLELLDQVLSQLGYSGKRYNDLYKVFDGEDGKIDIALATREGDEAVTYGRIAVTRFPFSFFENVQEGILGGFSFYIAPNELLFAYGVHSQNEADVKFSEGLLVNDEEFAKITRELRE